MNSYDDANHPSAVVLAHEAGLLIKPEASVRLNARAAIDPDGDELSYRWWQYKEAGTYPGSIEIENAEKQEASFVVPADARKGETIYVVCEVADDGLPPLTRYQQVIIEIE